MIPATTPPRNRPRFHTSQLPVAQGNFAEATPLFGRSVDIKKKVLGPEHADVATALNNYAMSLLGEVSALPFVEVPGRLFEASFRAKS